MKKPISLNWLEMNWQRPFEFQTVCDTVVHLSGLTGRKPFIWEVRVNANYIKFLLGFVPTDESKLKRLFSTHNNVQFSELKNKRANHLLASQIKINHQHFSLKTDNIESMVRSFLSISSNLDKNEEVSLQLVVGKSRAPSPIPKNLPNLSSTWFQRLTSNIPPLSPESQKLMKEKLHYATFQTVIRLGIVTPEKARQITLLNQAMASLRIIESNGASFRFKKINTKEIDDAEMPWSPQTHLSALELASLLMLPAGEADMPTFPCHPKTIIPPIAYSIPEKKYLRTFGNTMESTARPLHIPLQNALMHTQICAPTGAGKSVVITNLALQDIEAGRSVVVVDAKQDTITQILERIPEKRDRDVIVLDPSSTRLVGVNIFNLVHHGISPELVTDMLLNIFEKLFPDNFGIRSRDVLLAGISTLAKTPNSNLAMLPTLLTNKAFRQRILQNIEDPLGLESFWNYYENLSDAECQQLIAPSLNKLRQLFNRPSMRAILGQSNPKFSLMDIFTSRKVVLINLNKGVLGTESARLLGSIITASLHALTLRRAQIPPEKRHPVMIYIDEFSAYISVAEDFEESLAMARSLGVGYTLAHQTLSQLPTSLKFAIEANCKSKIIFSLGMSDAREIARQTTELSAEDLHTLPPYQVYARVPMFANHYKWISGRTNPLPPASRDGAKLFLSSLLKYGTPLEEVEQELSANLRTIAHQKSQTSKDFSLNLGRKKKENNA